MSVRFAPWTTATYALLWLVVVLQGWWPLIEQDASLWLLDPASAAARMTSRDLERALAIETGSALEQRLLGSLYGTSEEVLHAAIRVHEDVLNGAESDVSTSPVSVRLALLLLETGQLDEAFQLLEGLEEEALPLAGILAASQGSLDPEQQDGLLEYFVIAGLSNGYLDLAEQRIAVAAGDPERASSVRARVLARGERWKRRGVAILAANLGLLAFGAALLITRVRVLRDVLLGPGASPPWSLEDGIGVFVRGDFWNRLYFVAITWLWAQPFGAELAETWLGELVYRWGTLFASLPLLWLLHHHLLRPSGVRAVQAFGLDPQRLGLARLAGVGLCAIAVDLVGTHAISWASFWMDATASWAEGFDEILVWGSNAQALLTATDYVLWAPAFEELAFRGLLYFSLRRRLGPAAAAIASAGFFAMLHFYSLPGFLMTFWSGLVWALAFESTRSLLPGIAAHAVYNGLYVAGLVLLYR